MKIYQVYQKKLILEEQSPVNTEENYRYAFRVYESMLLANISFP